MSLERRVLDLQKKKTPRRNSLESRLEVPHIIDFVLDPSYLGLSLYPRQATVLKLIFLRDDLLTAYDRDVIAEWSAGYTLAPDRPGEHPAFQGNRGTPPDIYERILLTQEQGRRWFREVLMVVGRRGSKGFVCAATAAHVIWNLLALWNPQAHYGLPARKRLDLLVFAGQHAQARANQWQDLVDVLTQAPCFEPFIADVGSDMVTLFSPAQLANGHRPPNRQASIRISARAATPLGGRGPASFLQIYDEMAHIMASGANRSAEELVNAATPALAQFRQDSLLLEASSPWQQTGQFHTNYQQALQTDPISGRAINYDSLVLHLPSEELYKDYDRTGPTGLKAYPNGPTFPKKEQPVYCVDELAERRRRADPLTYRVEFDAQWATSITAYLPPEDIDALFDRWQSQPLTMQPGGRLAVNYVAHVDLSVSGANTAVVVAHQEHSTADQPHVVIDLIKVWQPPDFSNGRINYSTVEQELRTVIDHFPLSTLSFDQFGSAGLIERLQAHAQNSPSAKRRTAVSEKTATANRNFLTAETFKTALANRLVHSPHHELAEKELRFLELRNGKVDHPTSGPVQTSDVADCLFEVVTQLLGDHNGTAIWDQLSSLPPIGSHPGGFPTLLPDHSIAVAFRRSSAVNDRRTTQYHDPCRGRPARRRR